MKTIYYLFLFSLLFQTSYGQAQPSSEAGAAPKKKSFFQKLGEAALEDLKSNTTINGRPVGGGNGTFSGRGEIIENNWSEYGGGGTWQGAGHLDFVTTSPRNHTYFFEVAEPNTKITFSAESDMLNLPRGIVTDLNGGVNHYFDDYTLPKAGTYKIQIATQWRYQKGKYRMELKGPVLNLRQDIAPRWVEEKGTFGDEGGGGANANFFSPRNHVYTFEPEEGTVLDINLESNGVPVQVALVNPYGGIDWGMNGGEPGLSYLIKKIEKKGTYHIAVATVEPNAKAAYKLDVMGKLKTNPKRIENAFQSINGQFTNTSKRHEYLLEANPYIYEIVYRSISTPANTVDLYDPSGQKLDAHSDNSPTAQWIDRSFQIQKAGTYKLVVETEQANAGTYELLVWGSFSKITSRQIDTPNSESNNKVTNDKSKSKTPSPQGQILLTGQLKSSQVGIAYTDMKIIYEDLDTGTRMGEIIPEADGTYTISIAKGKRYGITALTPENTIASSQNIDLTRTITTTRLPDINVLPIEVGTTFSLNNIFFDTGNPVLLRPSYAELKRLAAILRTNPTLRVEISGHTDNVGSVTINQTLSQNRANSVLYYLQDQVPEASGLTARGYGSTKPISSNKTETGRQQNRRVEFRITGK